MLKAFQQWRRRRIIKRSTITSEQWSQAFAALPLLTGLTDKDKQRLQELAILFMHYKSFEPAQGLVLNQAMIMHIALQACLPILHLGLQAYDGWVSIIIYPQGFLPQHSYMDEAGVMHEEQDHLAGEAWLRGPVILGWEDARQAGELDGHNLVVHEFAHKLDMQNGVANGYPPLHTEMDRETWVAAFSQAFAHFSERCQSPSQTIDDLDCYAATSPAEFFAVFSEVFFERPALLKQYYPDVYLQLSLYYRQDPLSRLNRV
ncbi:MAG: zinc-dependent peptidase [Gammaproteobacteria bacterium]|nr:zinc-dependent peptidase [Gammaproteobacteria bacterium]